MTPLREGRLHRLDDATEALYLFGVADRADATRVPGWYLRRRMAGEAATIEAGPFASLEEASRAHLGPPTFTHGEEILQQDALVHVPVLQNTYPEVFWGSDGQTAGWYVRQVVGGPFQSIADAKASLRSG